MRKKEEEHVPNGSVGKRKEWAYQLGSTAAECGFAV
jgi:hypothetical protein